MNLLNGRLAGLTGESARRSTTSKHLWERCEAQERAQNVQGFDAYDRCDSPIFRIFDAKLYLTLSHH
jgi:hypothetical protein